MEKKGLKEMTTRESMKKFGVTTSKIVVEYWEVNAENELEAEQKLWKSGKKVDEEVFDYRVDEVYEI